MFPGVIRCAYTNGVLSFHGRAGPLICHCRKERIMESNCGLWEETENTYSQQWIPDQKMRMRQKELLITSELFSPDIIILDGATKRYD